MKHVWPLLFITLFSLGLAACGGSDSRMGHNVDGMTPLPKREEPKDEALVAAVADFVRKQNAPPNSDYDFVRVDLNGDGRRDGIVLFKLPHTHWCGWDGCGMAVFEAGSKTFTAHSTINNVRGPIYVSRTGHDGWRDIIIRVSGANMRDKNVMLAFDGRAYPRSPLVAETLHRPLSSIDTEKYFR